MLFEISFKDFVLPKPNSFSTGFQQAISCLDHPQVMAIFGNKFSNQVPMQTWQLMKENWPLKMPYNWINILWLKEKSFFSCIQHLEQVARDNFSSSVLPQYTCMCKPPFHSSEDSTLALCKWKMHNVKSQSATSASLSHVQASFPRTQHIII